MFVIMLSGKAQAGKDTFADILLNHIGAQGKRFSFAGRLKEIAKDFGWNGTKEGEGRSFLIDVGQILRGDYQLRDDGVYSRYTGELTKRVSYSLPDLYRDLLAKYTPHPNFWVDLVIDGIRFNAGVNVAVITDWRFINECRAMQAAFPQGCTIRINNTRCFNIMDPSETELDGFTFDHSVDNNGSMEDYKRAVLSWYESSGLKAQLR